MLLQQKEKFDMKGGLPTPCQDDVSERYNVEEDGGEQEDANSHPAEERHTPVEQAEPEKQ